MHSFCTLNQKYSKFHFSIGNCSCLIEAENIWLTLLPVLMYVTLYYKDNDSSTYQLRKTQEPSTFSPTCTLPAEPQSAATEAGCSQYLGDLNDSKGSPTLFLNASPVGYTWANTRDPAEMFHCWYREVAGYQNGPVGLRKEMRKDMFFKSHLNLLCSMRR